MAKLQDTTVYGNLDVTGDIDIDGILETVENIYENGDRVATRNWANSNFNNYTFSENHDDLSGVSSSDHHSRYSDSEARSALDGSNPQFGNHIGFNNDATVISHNDSNNESGAHWSNADAVEFQSDGNVGKVVVRAGYLEATNAGEINGDFTADTFYESGNRVATRTWVNNNSTQSHNDLTDVSSNDHHAKYTDSEARGAVNNSTISPSRIDVNGISGNSSSDGQNGIGAPTVYTSMVEAHNEKGGSSAYIQLSSDGYQSISTDEIALVTDGEIQALSHNSGDFSITGEFNEGASL